VPQPGTQAPPQNSCTPGQAQIPASQVPPMHVPQEPPQPSSPQIFPLHWGTQTHVPFWQTSLPAQLPQEPPQPLGPQGLLAAHRVAHPGGGGGGGETFAGRFFFFFFLRFFLALASAKPIAHGRAASRLLVRPARVRREERAARVRTIWSNLRPSKRVSSNASGHRPASSLQRFQDLPLS
jgi:hypothetical protein